MTNTYFHDFPNMDKVQVPVSDETVNKICKNSKKIPKTTKSHTGICVYVKKHN